MYVCIVKDLQFINVVEVLTVLVNCMLQICSNGQEVETQEIICVPLHSKHHWWVYIHYIVPSQLGVQYELRVTATVESIS